MSIILPPAFRDYDAELAFIKGMYQLEEIKLPAVAVAVGGLVNLIGISLFMQPMEAANANTN